MDETTVTRELQIKSKVFLLNATGTAVDTSTTKTATLKINNYSPEVETATLEQFQKTVSAFARGNSLDAAYKMPGVFIYQDSEGNKYSFFQEANMNSNVIEEVATVDTTDTTLTDIGWND